MAADRVGEHPVVPLPVEWPVAAPVLIGDSSPAEAGGFSLSLVGVATGQPGP